MYNISDFRARYGSQLERIDYTTREGVESIYCVSVISETTHSIVVEGTVILREGGTVEKRRIHLDDLVAVYEPARVETFKKVTL